MTSTYKTGRSAGSTTKDSTAQKRQIKGIYTLSEQQMCSALLDINLKPSYLIKLRFSGACLYAG